MYRLSSREARRSLWPVLTLVVAASTATPALASTPTWRADGEFIQQRDSAAGKTDTSRRASPPNVLSSATARDTAAKNAVGQRPAATADSTRTGTSSLDPLRRRSMELGTTAAIVALFVFGAGAVLSVGLVLLAFARGGAIEVEARWGGIGGGGGGWRLSGAFSYLLSALLFGGLFMSTVMVLMRGDKAPTPTSTSRSTTPKDSSGP